MASQNLPKKRFFSQNFDTKSSLELYKGWDHSENLLHSQKNRLTKDTAPLNLSQILSLFRKWCTSVSKVGKITAYVISCDVIGHEARLESDISLERYRHSLCVPQVIYLKNDSDRIGRHFFEPLFSLKFSYKRQKLTSKSLRIQDPKNSAEDGTLKNHFFTKNFFILN